MWNTRENTSKQRRNTQKILFCISLTKRAHLAEETGTPRHKHKRYKTRTHLSASQRKVGLGELHLGPVDPLSRPTLDRLPSRCSLVGDLILSS